MRGLTGLAMRRNVIGLIAVNQRHRGSPENMGMRTIGLIRCI